MDVNLLNKLNEKQGHAATRDLSRPVLIIAGAGTGKTNTLAHRVAYLIEHEKVDPARILLLTFTRRAAAEMLKRVESILNSAVRTQHSALSRLWGGTFHAVANRVLRLHCQSVGLAESFTVIDRSDAEDLLDEVRGDLGFDKGEVRFPRKGTALSIYSRCINACEPVEQALKAHFPWCMSYPDQLKQLFAAYVKRKQSQSVLDYDDLLLYWFHLMNDEQIAIEVRKRFDAVLVDEYQDTNALQASILRGLSPDGRGVTVVGDDAQSIYSFRAATINNILDFPKLYPNTEVVTLEQNYRSVQPILDATNAVIAQCPHRFEKNLFSTRVSKQKPRLTIVNDEEQQSSYLIERILAHHEAGIPLRKQAILFRAAHHSDALEVELGRRNIPFVKYGGLKFLEAAHVKDVLSILRFIENPRDTISAARTLQLMDGFGPAHTKRAIAHLAKHDFEVSCLSSFQPPAGAGGSDGQWIEFKKLIIELRPDAMALQDQLAHIRKFYVPILERRYDQAQVRSRDVEQLEQISSSFPSRRAMLTDLVLDPPSGTQDLAGPPLREEDYLILSTIHSAKGCEWDVVYVIHAADGNIPSDMATGDAEQIEEERRLFYVALTRAKDFLEVVFPLRYYAKKWATGDRHTYAQLTRFIDDSIVDRFEKVSLPPPADALDAATVTASAAEIQKKIAAMFESQ